MAYTYLEAVNDVLSELNEVLLTSTTFSSAVNVQRTVKEMVNRAYFDINNPVYKWPWLATNSSQDNFYGNTYVETVAGTRWYLLDPTSSNINEDFGHVDWNNFSLTTEGVSGESSPYTVRDLPYVPIETWRDHWAVTEEANKYNSESYDTPRRVIRSPDNRRFGLSPIPDKVYRIYFYAWDRPSKLENHDDTVNIPDQYYGVLIARTRYYAWQRKENDQQAAIALSEYEDGIKGMKQQEINPSPDYMEDDRIRFI